MEELLESREFHTSSKQWKHFKIKALAGCAVLLGVVLISSSRMRERIQGKFGGLAAISSAPIEFYGKVIDQDKKPLQGVEVVGGTGSFTGFMQQELRSYTTQTNRDGLFAFSGFRGDALILELKKNGYIFESDRICFRYSPMGPRNERFIPRSDSPVVFQMWKSIGAEPLNHYSARAIQVPSDGTTIMVNLTDGSKVAVGGDLLVTVKWGPRDAPGSYSFDWLVKIGAVQGGLVESTGDTMFLAPVDGYQASYDYQFVAADQESALVRTYYVAIRDHKIYGRIRLWLHNQPGRSETDLSLSVWLNPSGSRNLEGILD